MPDWISSSDLFGYFYYIKNNQMQNTPYNAKRLLQIADFFESSPTIEKLIKTEIIPTLNVDNALAFLEDSYQKLTIRKEACEEIWFMLFMASMEAVAENFIFYVVEVTEEIR